MSSSPYRTHRLLSWLLLVALISAQLSASGASAATVIRDARNHTRSFTYDAADQVTSTTDPLLRTTAWEYNTAGQRTRQDDPRGSGFDLTYSFDELDRLSEVQAGSSANLAPISLSYNARSEQLSMADGTGTTSFGYDLLGRITGVSAPDTGAVAYTYNALGQRTGISYPGSGAPSLTYSYKPDGQLDYVNQSQHILPLAQYSYDSAGRLQQISHENGATTLLSYSALDQVRELSTQVGGSDVSRFLYTFDRDGQTSVVTETLGVSARSISYGYDGLARLTSADASSGADYAYRYTYVVTADGQLIFGRIDRQPRGGHIDIAGGDPVRAAGEVKFVDGQIRWVDNTSGHYLPKGPGARAAAEEAFRNAGFGEINYIEKVWNGSKWVPVE